MHRLDPNLMTADERIGEVGLILSRAIARRAEKLKSENTKDMRDYSLDLEAAGSIHGQKRKEKNN
jgi:hypothetical protein